MGKHTGFLPMLAKQNFPDHISSNLMRCLIFPLWVSCPAVELAVRSTTFKVHRQGMWGWSGCGICHPTDCQDWIGWSGWVGRGAPPPSPIHVCLSQSCVLGQRGWPSPQRKGPVFSQRHTNSCIPLLESLNRLSKCIDREGGVGGGIILSPEKGYCGQSGEQQLFTTITF